MKGEVSRFRWWGHLLWATPLLHYAFVLLFYVSASISLGEWANTAGADDPKGFFGGVPLLVSGALLLLSFSVAPLVVFVGRQQKRVFLFLLLYCVSLLLSIVLFRVFTPWLGMWIGD